MRSLLSPMNWSVLLVHPGGEDALGRVLPQNRYVARANDRSRNIPSQGISNETKEESRLVSLAADRWHPLWPRSVVLRGLCDDAIAPLWTWRQVVDLDLSRCRLRVLPQLGLPLLERLDVSHNRLQRVSARLMLPSLVHLDLSHNCLAAIPPLEPEALPRMKYLSLSHNTLRSLPDFQHPVLQQLHASHNKLGHLPTVLRLPELVRLDLSHNALAAFPSMDANDLPKLKCLNVSNNELSVLPGDDLPVLHLSLLERLDISDNRLHCIPARLLLPSLIFLDLSQNDIVAMPHSALKELTALRHLDVSNNRLRDITADMTRMCGPGHTLRSIEVAGNDSLVLPRASVVERGGMAVCRFFADLSRGQKTCWSQPVLVVGQEASGKTALCQALLGHPCLDQEQSVEASTVGIDSLHWPTVSALRQPDRLVGRISTSDTAFEMNSLFSDQNI